LQIARELRESSPRPRKVATPARKVREEKGTYQAGEIAPEPTGPKIDREKHVHIGV